MDKARPVKKKRMPKAGKKDEPFDLSVDEFFAVSRRLERHHAVFYKLWELGVPMFTRSIPTAAVGFDKKGHCIQFWFNPDFWQWLSEEERDFIIAHECLHVILNHGSRAKNCSRRDRKKCNIAMDVVVNQMLLDKFGFDRDEIDLDMSYCWLDNVFCPPEVAGETFEYYFNRIVPRGGKKGKDGEGGYVLVDIHDFLDGSESEVIGRLSDSLSQEEKDEIKDLIEKHFQDAGKPKEGEASSGSVKGGEWAFMKSERVEPKRKWETIITRWSDKLLRNEFDNFEHWMRINRRLVMLPEDIILPTEMEIQDREDDGRIQVYFFLDTSGSCSHLAERFWKAAMSVPKDRFDKKLFCFDTKVYEVNERDRKLYGFGGTSFDILEHRIQKDMKDGIIRSYPKAVFVITDGWGNQVKPEIPGRWHWFLSDQPAGRPIGSLTSGLIPKACRLHNLADFE